MEKYSNVTQWAVGVILPFATTYLCETGFSRYAATKNKYRNRLDAGVDMKIQLPIIVPNIKQICDERKQKHKSN
jgi:hypothetical protein